MNTPLSGIRLGAAGIVVLCAMDAVAKALGAHLPTFEVVFVRFAGAAVWLVLWIWLSRGARPKRSNLGRHIMRGRCFRSPPSCSFMR
ncbi:hypothetical protein N8D56_00100 [Devosia sp. A8/3-2]|nr:hypothetical protein N8D56_00100 [Devosia sp. A8/3-2]